jgi:predicted transcriptional regulator
MKEQVLDILKGAPETTPEKIANMTGLDALTVKQIIDSLVITGLLTSIGGIINLTPKGLEKSTPIIETELYTVYKYVTRDEVPAAKQSRKFCTKLLTLSAVGKRWTRDSIDDITNQFGEDAWSYRGGFYTNPDTHKTTAFCRHIWKAITKSRTKK